LSIAEELKRLTDAAKAGKLSMADVSDGTISISNIGSIGATYTHPVISPPEVAIGALGKIQTVPRYNSTGTKVRPTKIMNVSWSADHRVLDGATVVHFNNLVKTYLEEPTTMMLELLGIERERERESS